MLYLIPLYFDKQTVCRAGLVPVLGMKSSLGGLYDPSINDQWTLLKITLDGLWILILTMLVAVLFWWYNEVLGFCLN